MANSIERVRDAERKAEELITGAHAEAKQIVERAKMAAEGIIADGIKISMDNAAEAIAAAHLENRTLLEKLSVDLETERQALENIARNRAAQAVEQIYKSMA